MRSAEVGDSLNQQGTFGVNSGVLNGVAMVASFECFRRHAIRRITRGIFAAALTGARIEVS